MRVAGFEGVGEWWHGIWFWGKRVWSWRRVSIEFLANANANANGFEFIEFGHWGNGDG